MLLESSQALSNVLLSLKSGNIAIKEINKGMKVEEIERIKEDMKDIYNYQDEIGDFLKNYTNNLADNEELEDEINKMENEILNQEIVEVGKS